MVSVGNIGDEDCKNDKGLLSLALYDSSQQLVTQHNLFESSYGVSYGYALKGDIILMEQPNFTYNWSLLVVAYFMWKG